MKKTLWIAAVTLLLAGSACKQDENRTELDEQLPESMPAQTQRGELREDVDVDTTRPADVDTTRPADVDTDDDSEEFKRDMRARLDQLDARIEQLEAETDEESKQAAAELRQRRDELAAKLDRAEDKADTNWEEFKADVSRGFDELQRDVDRAFE